MARTTAGKERMTSDAVDLVPDLTAFDDPGDYGEVLVNARSAERRSVA
jgi:hypothetical protein